jgi:hypothetical protein
MSPPGRVAASILSLAGSFLPSLADAPASDPPWGLSESLLTALADRSERYETRAPRVTCVETIRSVRFRDDRSFVNERRLHYAPGGSHAGVALPDLRFEVKPKGSIPARPPKRIERFPSASDWARLFSARNQLFFMYRELGTRLVEFDLVREIEFRGWLPFGDGRDIREWEGVALVESTGLRLVEVRARPRNQEARLAKLYEKWTKSLKFKIGLFAGPFFMPLVTIRTVRRPLAYDVLVRYDHRYESLRLPTLLRYEIRRAVGRDETAPWSLATLRYTDCRNRAEPAGAALPAAGSNFDPRSSPPVAAAAATAERSTRASSIPCRCSP